MSTKAISGVCRHCGCTEARACPSGCAWADETRSVCTNCIDRPEELARARALYIETCRRLEAVGAC